jgi:hypothetical protein
MIDRTNQDRPEMLIGNALACEIWYRQVAWQPEVTGQEEGVTS